MIIDLTPLTDRIDSLEKRVQALETPTITSGLEVVIVEPGKNAITETGSSTSPLILKGKHFIAKDGAKAFLEFNRHASRVVIENCEWENFSNGALIQSRKAEPIGELIIDSCRGHHNFNRHTPYDVHDDRSFGVWFYNIQNVKISNSMFDSNGYHTVRGDESHNIYEGEKVGRIEYNNLFLHDAACNCIRPGDAPVTINNIICSESPIQFASKNVVNTPKNLYSVAVSMAPVKSENGNIRHRGWNWDKNHFDYSPYLKIIDKPFTESELEIIRKSWGKWFQTAEKILS